MFLPVIYYIDQLVPQEFDMTMHVRTDDEEESREC